MELPAFAVQVDFVNGRPVIFFVKNEFGRVGEYLAYRIVGEMEEVTLVDYVSNPTFVYSPIVKIDKSPKSFSRSSKATSSVRVYSHQTNGSFKFGQSVRLQDNL